MTYGVRLRTVSGEDGSDWLGVVWLLGKKERRILSWVYYYPWDIVFDASTHSVCTLPYYVHP